MDTPPTTATSASAQRITAQVSFRDQAAVTIEPEPRAPTETYASWHGAVRDASFTSLPRAEGFFERLGRREICRWMLSYLAAAWVLLQFAEVLGDIWPIGARVQQAISLALLLGILPCLVIAWFHGEKGRQCVSRAEVALLVSSLAVAGSVLWALA